MVQTRSTRGAAKWSLALIAVVAPPLLVPVTGCRQLLGIDGDPPLLDGGADGGADGGTGGAPASPFTIVHSVPEGESLLAIWGTGPDFFVAVGTSKVSFFSRNGALTRLGGAEQGRDYLAVWGFSDQDIYAVGQTSMGGGFIDHFDGTGWTDAFEAPVPLLGVWGTTYDGTKAVIAVGAAGSAYGSNTNQIAWTSLFHLPPGPNDPSGVDEPRLWGISGRSIDDFAIAGDSRVYHYEADAGQLAHYEPTMQTGTLFRSIWQSPDPETSIYLGTNFFGLSWFSAKGNEQTGYPLAVLSRDESAPNAANSYIEGVWGTDQRIVGVGDLGRIYAYDTGLTTVAQLVSPTDEPLTGVWGSSVDDVWIVGRRELILHGSVR